MNVSVEVEPLAPLPDAFDPNCPARTVLDNVTSRWAVLVLWALLDSTLRFSDLRRRVGGVSEKMLAQTLQRLERDGFVLRVAHPVIPPHVDYSLTPLGEPAARQVAGLASWVEGEVPAVLAARAAYDARSAAGPVR
jgi:DNA-binding HxlR family transcriptional regulator